MNEHFEHIIRSICADDTSGVHRFFRQPGGRKYLKHLTLLLIHTLPHHYDQKEELYLGFIDFLDMMEQELRQKEGGELLERVFKKY